MTTLQILFLLNILAGRLVFDSEKYSVKKLFWYRSIITLIAGLFIDHLAELLIFYTICTVVILIDILWLKNDNKTRYTVFLISMFFIFPGIIQIFESLAVYYKIENPATKPLISLFMNFPIINSFNAKFDSGFSLLVLTMYLFTIKESTIIIRGILDSIKVVPKKEKVEEINEKDEEEYNRGKYIGILERTFIYFLIVFQQYTAIGFVLGLKSFARYKDLDKRGFAEYFIIGSMLSILTAILPAIYVFIQI